MEREGILNSERAGGDWVGGCCTKERDRVDGAQPEAADGGVGHRQRQTQALALELHVRRLGKVRVRYCSL
jgi:hypothetical protein